MDTDIVVPAENHQHLQTRLSFTADDIHSLAKFYEVFIDIDRRLKRQQAEKEKVNQKSICTTSQKSK
jgi:hypothetical protein